MRQAPNPSFMARLPFRSIGTFLPIVPILLAFSVSPLAAKKILIQADAFHALGGWGDVSQFMKGEAKLEELPIGMTWEALGAHAGKEE